MSIKNKIQIQEENNLLRAKISKLESDNLALRVMNKTLIDKDYEDNARMMAQTEKNDRFVFVFGMVIGAVILQLAYLIVEILMS